ncbi:MAG TPA: hypothetical protein VEU72_06825 [Nitrosopumilaceae archaeon]|nr:hypothetical protein [Nitrosopumilaceae archaeon]
MLNPSKKVFISPNCLQEENKEKFILEKLAKQKISSQNIFKNVNLDIANNGDYIIRCIDDTIQVFILEFMLNFGFVTKRISVL